MYKKRNVAYVKPQEPNFLTKLKKEAGYVAGPDIDTKKEQLPAVDSDSDSEKPDENPVVVVLKPGDLTAEEVAKITADKKSEKVNAKADLSQRVIFQQPITLKRKLKEEPGHSKKSSKKKVSKQLLSFDQNEENEC